MAEKQLQRNSYSNILRKIGMATLATSIALGVVSCGSPTSPTTTTPQQPSMAVTIQNMINEIEQQDKNLINVTNNQSIAAISLPAVMFEALDTNANNTGKSQNVLVMAWPLGYGYESWTSKNPTQVQYVDLNNQMQTDTILYYAPAQASWFFGGPASGVGQCTNCYAWKEIETGTNGIIGTITPPTQSTDILATGNAGYDQFDMLIISLAIKYGIPDPMLIKAQGGLESQLNPSAYNNENPCNWGGWISGQSGSWGILQVNVGCTEVYPKPQGPYGGMPFNQQQATDASYNLNYALPLWVQNLNLFENEPPGCSEGVYLLEAMSAWNAGLPPTPPTNCTPVIPNTLYVEHVLQWYDMLKQEANYTAPFNYDQLAGITTTQSIKEKMIKQNVIKPPKSAVQQDAAKLLGYVRKW